MVRALPALQPLHSLRNVILLTKLSYWGMNNPLELSHSVSHRRQLFGTMSMYLHHGSLSASVLTKLTLGDVAEGLRTWERPSYTLQTFIFPWWQRRPRTCPACTLTHPQNSRHLPRPSYPR